MLTVYGISHCDTVKKTRAWLTDQAIAHVFHDYKKLGVPTDRLDLWIKTMGWESLINRRGTTWRGLDESTKQAVVDGASAKALMLSHASVIKRPVIERHGVVIAIGFDAALASILAQ